jgi:hypothetical protein
MNYVKTYESFNESDLQIIKDILLEIEDEGFKIEYHYDSNFKITHIMINPRRDDNKVFKFTLSDNMVDSLVRVSSFLNKTIQGFWRYGNSAESKLHVYNDSRGIRTSGYQMDKNWPEMYALRIMIHH